MPDLEIGTDKYFHVCGPFFFLIVNHNQLHRNLQQHNHMPITELNMLILGCPGHICMHSFFANYGNGLRIFKLPSHLKYIKGPSSYNVNCPLSNLNFYLSPKCPNT